MSCFRRFGVLVRLFSAALLVLSTAAAQETGPSAVVPEDDIAQIVEGFMQQHGVPGMSIAIARQNQLVYAKGFGLADVEHLVPATEDTLYRTASIAKPMTALVILSLAEEGKLDLDAEVQRYRAEYPKKRWPLTSRQLLGHLGGVRHYKNSAESHST